MTEEKEVIRSATFSAKRKHLNLWLSPNTYGWRECANLEEAKKLIEQTGVSQRLRESVR